MSLSFYALLIVVPLVILAIWIQIKLFRMYRGRNGERIMRRRIRGNWVP